MKSSIVHSNLKIKLVFLFGFLYTDSMKIKNILKTAKQWTKVRVHIKGAPMSFIGKVGLRDNDEIYYVTNPVHPWLHRVHVDDIVEILS